MNADRFWQIIDATCAATQEEQLEKFKRELQCLTAEELIEFERFFAQHTFAAYNWDLWVVAWLCMGGRCSDDSFSDFRSWLISRGHAIYDAALADADTLVDRMRETEDPRFEEFAYSPSKIYRDLTDGDVPRLDIQHPKEPSGGDWLRAELKDRTNTKILNRCVVLNKMGGEEYSAIKRRFPRIWALCVEKGIIKTGEQSSQASPSSNKLPTPEQIAAAVDPNLAKTDFAAYLKALGDAAQKAYKKKD